MFIFINIVALLSGKYNFLVHTIINLTLRIFYCALFFTATSLEQDLLDTYERIHGIPCRNNFWLEQQEKWRLFITKRISRLSITEYTEKTSLVHIAATCRVIITYILYMRYILFSVCKKICITTITILFFSLIILLL